MIRAVIFDCFGVLCSGSLDYMRSISPSEHLEEFNELSRAFDRDYVDRAEYVTSAARLLKRSPADIHEIMQNYCIRNDYVVELVRTTHTTHKTALLSNIGRGFINDFFSRDELDELFDTVVLSSEVGTIKPEQAIYDLTAQRLGVLPEECVMIDDSERNISGAERVGMRGLYFQTLEQCQAELATILGEKNA